MLKLYEFVLWNNCPNNCKFCYLKGEYQSSKKDMINMISLVDDFVDRITEDSSILLTGGEMFVNLDVETFEKLESLYLKIFNNNNIKIIYFNTNLIYNVSNYLTHILDLANEYGIIDKIHFTTSDDSFGRFNEESRQLFYKNIALLHDKYDKLQIIVNTILTKRFCDEIIKDRYNINYYCKRYGVIVNIIPYIDINSLPEYLPDKEEVIKSLLILKKQNPEWFDGYVDIFTRKREMVVYTYDHHKNCLGDSTAHFNKCNHPENFSHCFDDGTCFGCLLQAMK